MRYLARSSIVGILLSAHVVVAFTSFAAGPLSGRTTAFSSLHAVSPSSAIATTSSSDSSPLATSSDSIDRLVDLCYASSLSYLPLDSIASSEYATKVSNLKPVVQVVEPKTESGATIFEDAKDSDVIVVACRGSATPKNFATNLRFRLTPMPKRFEVDARAHEGFQEAAEGLWERLEPNLFGGSSVGKKIIFTGHSLGAGTSEIVALHAATASASGTTISDVTTFGGPCIGDATFASYVNDEALASTDIKHIVHSADPILANNGPLWEKLGFERSGSTLQCDPFEPRVWGSNANQDRDRNIVPWNILDHCKYLGVFVGPRLVR